MVGSAIVRLLKKEGFSNLILKTHSELDLINQTSVREFFEYYEPEYVFLCAGKVGGINANNILRAQFIYENLIIQNNVIHYAHSRGVKKLIFISSSCVYPTSCPQPMKEEYLLTGPLEQTNEPYAIAKIAGMKMCESYYYQYGHHFFSIIPTNSFGPNDNYDFDDSHVMAAIIRKVLLARLLEEKKYNKIRKNLEIFPISSNVTWDPNWTDADVLGVLKKFGIKLDENKNVTLTLWGTGKPLREFIYVDDIASAALFIMKYDIDSLYANGNSHLNVGTGEEISIFDLANTIASEFQFEGEILFDSSKPDGMQKKCMDISRLNKLGWNSIINLRQGIKGILINGY